MPPPESKSGSSAPESARRNRELEEKNLLIQTIRKDLILSQITVLELNDTIMRKETDKADAVSILAELEHVLEEKISYIFELDRVLNLRIASLQQELAAETAAKAARDGVIQDLVQKLDTANREVGAAHTLAGGYAQDLAQVRAQLQRTADDLAGSQTALAATRQELAATAAARAGLDREITGMRAALSWRLTAPFRALRRMFS